VPLGSDQWCGGTDHACEVNPESEARGHPSQPGRDHQAGGNGGGVMLTIQLVLK